MSHWSVDDLIKEIQDLAKLSASRKDAKVVTKLADQIKYKIDGIQMITSSELLKASDAIAAASLTDTVKDSLQEALDTRSLETNNSTQKLVTKSQILKCIWNYLSVVEFSTLVQAPLPTMVQIICSRLRKVGLKSMKELTKKPAVQFMLHILVARGEPQPTAADVYKLAGYFKTAFDDHTQTALVPGLASYPTTPAELGQASCLFELGHLCILISLRAIRYCYFPSICNLISLFGF